MHRFTIEQDLSLVGDNCAAQHFDQSTFPGAIVAYHGQHFTGFQIEVRMVQGCNLPISLRDAPSFQYHGAFWRQLYPGSDIRRHRCFFLEIWSRATALITRMPVTRSCHKGSMPVRVRPFRSTDHIKVPIRVPHKLPLPPNRLVPPMTTAVMLSRFALCRALGSAFGIRPRANQGPMPHSTPEKV